MESYLSQVVRTSMARTFREAFRNDHRGHAGDTAAILNSWDFDLADIPNPEKITFYVGEEDTDAPVAMVMPCRNP